MISSLGVPYSDTSSLASVVNLTLESDAPMVAGAGVGSMTEWLGDDSEPSDIVPPCCQNMQVSSVGEKNIFTDSSIEA